MDELSESVQYHKAHTKVILRMGAYLRKIYLKKIRKWISDDFVEKQKAKTETKKYKTNIKQNKNYKKTKQK